MPKEKEVPTTSTKTIEQASIIVGSIEVTVNKSDELIDTKNLAQSTMQKVKIDVAANIDEVKNNELKSKYFQSKWCHSGLTKTQ